MTTATATTCPSWCGQRHDPAEGIFETVHQGDTHEIRLKFPQDPEDPVARLCLVEDLGDEGPRILLEGGDGVPDSFELSIDDAAEIAATLRALLEATAR
ncbi:MAG: hypothetical protein V9E85_04385 [Candidatus Nanopelagicales bacterium]|jgi:hypothetical protein